MKFNLLWLISIFVSSIFINSSLFACRYTVREIGLSDLGSEPYLLYFYYDSNTISELPDAFNRIAFAALLETNVKAETINIDRQTSHPAMKYFRSLKFDCMPAIILIDATEKMITFPFVYSKENYQEPVWQIIEEVVTSKFRQEIMEKAIDSYGIVLLLEGKSEYQNAHAKQDIEYAIHDITKILKIMPKPIKNPPQLLMMKDDQLQSERVLLWSIGIHLSENDFPAAVVFYGRGRKIGPIFVGEELTAQNIFNVLALIGADCECGLDRTLILEKMFPHRWERKWQKVLVKNLGLDIESPMVLSEMSQILALAPSLQGKNKKINPLLAYSEGIIKYKNSVDEIERSTTGNSNRFDSKTATNNFSIITKGLFLSGIFFLMILLMTAFIFARAKWRKHQ